MATEDKVHKISPTIEKCKQGRQSTVKQWLGMPATSSVLLLEVKIRPIALQLNRMQVEHVRSAEFWVLAAI